MLFRDIEIIQQTTKEFAERIGISEKEMIERAEKIAEELGVTVSNALNIVAEDRYEEIQRSNARLLGDLKN